MAHRVGQRFLHHPQRVQAQAVVQVADQALAQIVNALGISPPRSANATRWSPYSSRKPAMRSTMCSPP
jgi:hypothetical protein